MKIKTQFKLFVACIIAVPLVFSFATALFRYYNSPDRLLMNSYQRMRKISEEPLSRRDLRMVQDALHHFPPDAEMLLLANQSEILLSTIKDFKSQDTVDMYDLYRYIRETSDRFFYQISAPELLDNSADITLITRMPRKNNKNHPPKPPRKLFHTLTIFIIIFELICISFAIYVSMTISRSITMLEKNTERIAGGELDKPLEKPRDLRTTNEITRLAENLDKMRLALKDEAERRIRFIMGISHDLRTPVAVIRGYTEAMNDGLMADPESQKKALDIIGSKTSQLETMINTLINFMKLESTDWREQLKKQKIRPFLEDFAQSCRNTGDVFKRDVTTAISLSPDTEVAFDSQLFQRALENIFSNAVRYTQEGDSITFSAKEAGSEIFVTIADTGIGMSDEDLEHIFDLFYRASGSRREEGMGIGLSVVKNIIETHGWNISVQSKKDQGSVFTITIHKLTQVIPKKD